jgi:hypothetical protein
MTTPSFQFYDDLRREIDSSPELTALCQSIARGERDAHWSVTDGLIRRAGKVLVPSQSPLVQAALQMSHTAGHERVSADLATPPRQLLPRA